ncbi:MAG: hypothetical protein ACI38Q_05625 [Candidatus Bruticola sp.]
MKKSKVIGFVIFAALFIACFCSEMVSAHPGGPGEHHPRREPKCEVKVCNDSDFPIYVMIDGRNEGSVWKHSSETFQIHKWGSMKVEAEAKGETASDWIELNPGNEKAEVTFNNDDFPSLDPKADK